MPIVEPIPAFEDNYVWLLRDEGRPAVAVVDPGDADPVIARLDAEGLRLAAILITHHHGDHTGGVGELAERWPDALVVAPVDRRIRGANRTVGDGDDVAVAGLSVRLGVLEVPGHTATHLAYLGSDMLFCGDTLFAGGCGRVLDGTFEQLAASLQRIASLPPQTLVYCAHEYTLANLGFAAWVEPENAVLAERAASAERLRAAGRPTVPSELGLELATNPFLRTGEPAVIAAAERFAGRPLATPAEVFTALRRWKDERYD